MDSNKIEQAKQTLRDAGYQVANLWHIDDVKGNYECTDDEAMEVLEDALVNQRIMEEIHYTIRLYAEDKELKSKDN